MQQYRKVVKYILQDLDKERKCIAKPEKYNNDTQKAAQAQLPSTTLPETWVEPCSFAVFNSTPQ